MGCHALLRFSVIPIKLPMAIFIELGQKFFKFVWNHGRPQITKAILRRKCRARGIRLPDFRLYSKAAIIKTVWSWHQKRHTSQQNRVESPEISPLIDHGQLVSDKEARV